MYECERDVDPAFEDVSGVVLAHLLGPVLAHLSELPEGREGDAQLVDSAVGLARLGSWVDAQKARVAAEMLRRSRAEVAAEGAHHPDGRGSGSAFAHEFEDERLARSMVSIDLSLALGVTGWAADRDMWLGERLSAHAALGTALARGRLDRRRAELILSEVCHLDSVRDRDAVIASLVGDGTHAADHPDNRDGLVRELRRTGTTLVQLPPAKVRHAVRRECLRRDPDLAAAREAVSRSNRNVGYGTLPDGQAKLVLTGPAHEVGAAYANVDLAARSARSGGDSRALDQLRHDIAVGWLTEGAFGTLVTRPGRDNVTAATESATPSAPRSATRLGLPRPRQALVVIAMSDRTALGLDDDPATFFGPDGQVPLPASLGRAIAHDPRMSTWLGLYTEPESGIATDISTRYRPPPRQQMFVKLRDGMRSRLPSSNSTRIELDHVRAYDHDHPEAGGQTTPADLACAGLRDHHLKTDRALAVTGDANACLTFTTHTGHGYESWPMAWHDPRAG